MKEIRIFIELFFHFATCEIFQTKKCVWWGRALENREKGRIYWKLLAYKMRGAGTVD